MIEAGHPLPDSECVVAAERVLALVEGLTADDLVLVLSERRRLLPAHPAGSRTDPDRRAGRQRTTPQVRGCHRRDQLRAQAPLRHHGRTAGRCGLAGRGDRRSPYPTCPATTLLSSRPDPRWATHPPSPTRWRSPNATRSVCRRRSAATWKRPSTRRPSRATPGWSAATWSFWPHPAPRSGRRPSAARAAGIEPVVLGRGGAGRGPGRSRRPRRARARGWQPRRGTPQTPKPRRPRYSSSPAARPQ